MGADRAADSCVGAQRVVGMFANREPLHASVRRALACPDEVWYRQMLMLDMSACPLTDEESVSVLCGAMAAATEVAKQIDQVHPTQSPENLASTLKLEIGPMGDDAGIGDIPLLGLYQPGGRQILLHEKTLAEIERFIIAQGLASLTPVADLRRCALYHEIFHAIEDETPGIFTRSAMLQRKVLGVIPSRRGLASASEIGAIHFSRLMARTSYSPRVFEFYLLLSMGRVTSDDLPH